MEGLEIYFAILFSSVCFSALRVFFVFGLAGVDGPASSGLIESGNALRLELIEPQEANRAKAHSHAIL